MRTPHQTPLYPRPHLRNDHHGKKLKERGRFGGQAKAHGGVLLQTQKMCEDCGAKHAHYGTSQTLGTPFHRGFLKTVVALRRAAGAKVAVVLRLRQETRRRDRLQAQALRGLQDEAGALRHRVRPQGPMYAPSHALGLAPYNLVH